MLTFLQTQKQTLKITPQQIQLLNFLQLSTLELEEYVKNELEENPLLEEGAIREESAENDFDGAENDGTTPEEIKLTKDYADWDEFADDDVPDYKTQVNNFSNDDEFYSAPVVQEYHWRDELKTQQHFLPLNDRQRLLLDYLIDSLDDNGFLSYSAEEIADDVSFSNNIFVEVEEVETVLSLLRKLDPPGIGARDLQECLVIQLSKKKEAGEDVELALEIVTAHMDELAARNYEKIMRQLTICSDTLKLAIHQITALNAKPIIEGSVSSIAVKDNILPDYLLYFDGNRMEISLNSGRIPELRVNSSFAEMIRSSNDKDTKQYVQNKITTATWLIDAIKQREGTMMKAMRAIAYRQEDFFRTGDLRHLKPMILKDIAECIGMDISTISRVTSGKYVQTPFGTIHLKNLFTEGIRNDDGAEVSNREIQQIVAELIEKEDKIKPLNDFQVMDLLAERGFHIARRTVAKYRENQNILPAQMRRVL